MPSARLLFFEEQPVHSHGLLLLHPVPVPSRK
jgi:hypothetical protein